MQGIWTATGPMPPAGVNWCSPCTQLWRGTVLNLPAVKARIRAAEAAVGKVTVIDLLDYQKEFMPDLALPQEAVCWGISAITTGPQGIPMYPIGTWLCWTHLVGLTPTAGSGLVQAGGPLPEGEIALPMGDVPEIGRRG